MNPRRWYKLKKIVPKRFQEPIISSIYYLRSLLYAGSNVYCPCCDSSFKKFYPKGKFGTCPRCGSGSRHRLLYLYLRNRTNFFTDKSKVLHFAPEHCFQKTFKSLPNISYLSADLCSARAMVVIDITNINYSDDYFDIILSSHVLEHVPNDKKAMRELFRVLNPGGWSIHQVPIDYSREKTFEDTKIKTVKERERIYGHHDHKRIYGKDYKNRLEEAGFTVKVDSYANKFSIKEIQKYGIDRDEKIYLCKKVK